jgi:excisionase family DNA binding protein
MKNYISVARAAKILGISSRLLYQKLARREISHVRIGRKIVVAEDELERFMEERTIERVDWGEKAAELLK